MKTLVTKKSLTILFASALLISGLHYFYSAKWVKSISYRNPLSITLDKTCSNPSELFGYGESNKWSLVSENSCGWVYNGPPIRIIVPFRYRLDTNNSSFCVGSEVPFKEGTLWMLQDWESCVPNNSAQKT